MCVSAALSSFFFFLFFETSEYLRQLIRIAFVAANVATTKTGKFDFVPRRENRISVVAEMSYGLQAEAKMPRCWHIVRR